MPWKETCAVDERTLFIAEYLKDELSVAELCRRFGISRKTGHKWIARFAEGSWEGLKDRSHRPHQHPWTTPAWAVKSVIAAKKAFPSLGPKKLKVLLDTDGKAAQLLNPEVANPYTVFLDKAGRLVKSHAGYQKGDEAKHEAVIQKLLKES